MSITSHFYCLLLLAFLPTTSPLLAQTASPLVIGEQQSLHSTILKEKRLVNVYLPPSYGRDSSRQYPVLYVLDGGLKEDFLHISGLTQFASMPWIKLIPEMIVVGIVNVDRRRDFTYPSQVEADQKDFPTAGHAALFIQFLEQELLPFVQKNYRCTPNATLLGQSLGGLLASQILLEQPDLFQQYIIVSPSIWWDAESLLQKPANTPTMPPAVYIAVGKEGRVMQRTANQFYRKLKALPQRQRLLEFQYFPKHDHGDVLHQAAYAAFEYLFAAVVD